MRLADLHPQCTREKEAPTLRMRIIFDCPRCGSPRRISIPARYEEPEHPTYQITSGAFAVETLTLVPSIVQANHGREYPCGAHFTIEDGRIVWQ